MFSVKVLVFSEPVTYVDKHGIIHVGGRLSRSHLTHSQTHPVILSGKFLLCYLLFHAKHVALSQCGPRLLLSSICNRVHILGARRLSRATCRSCVVCHWSTAQTDKQMMGLLPACRVNPSPPFTICGVDYTGPFLLK